MHLELRCLLWWNEFVEQLRTRCCLMAWVRVSLKAIFRCWCFSKSFQCTGLHQTPSTKGAKPAGLVLAVRDGGGLEVGQPDVGQLHLRQEDRTPDPDNCWSKVGRAARHHRPARIRETVGGREGPLLRIPGPSRHLPGDQRHLGVRVFQEQRASTRGRSTPRQDRRQQDQKAVRLFAQEEFHFPAEFELRPSTGSFRLKTSSALCDQIWRDDFLPKIRLADFDSLKAR